MLLKKNRGLLLCLSTVGALTAAMMSSAGERASTPLKLNVQPSEGATAHKEEMVSRLIVKSHPTAGARLRHSLQMHDASELVRTANVGMSVVRPMSGNAHVIKLDTPVTLTEARSIAARLMQDDSVELVEPDRIRRVTSFTPNDPSYTSQWHYFAPAGANKGGANLPNAWTTTTGVAGVTVAVIDTGYRQHADLGTVLQGYDFIHSTVMSNDGDARDTDAQDPGDWVAADECGAGEPASNSSWHGTHVAGTIAALMSNGLGGTGIAPNIQILPVRVMGKCGGFTSDIVDGMLWAAGFAVVGVPANAHPANVLNMSLGGSGACSNIEQNAITQIVNAGKVVVVAAGNDGATTVSAPANCVGAIAVTAHAIDGDNAHYANIGAQIAISAPGGGCGAQAYAAGCTFGAANGPGIYSLLNSGTHGPVADSYASYQGTSMATPHVTGVIALMLSVNPALTPVQVKTYLQTSARAHPAGTTCTQSPYAGLCGAGLLDAGAALIAVSNLPPTISLTNASQVVSPAASVALSAVANPSSGRSISSYAWTQLSGASVGTINNANTANASFTAPTSGSYTFQLTVTDSAAQSSTATATVRVNSPPVLTAVAPQTGVAATSLSFSVSATDVDGDVLTFHPVSIPSGATLSATGVFNWANPAVGSYVMTYYARDNDVNSTQGSVSITVTGGSGATATPPAAASSGGGGSMDGGWMFALTLFAMLLRIFRAKKLAYETR